MIEDIKLICIDVDGTLTNGNYFVDHNGNVTKSFNTRDFYAINRLQKLNKLNKLDIFVYILTSDKSMCTVFKSISANIPFYIDIPDKLLFMNEKIKEIKEQNGFIDNMDQVAFIGDAENDLEVMKTCGWTACPGDAISEIKEESNYIADSKGGSGAVYEILRYFCEQRKIDWIQND